MSAHPPEPPPRDPHDGDDPSLGEDTSGETRQIGKAMAVMIIFSILILAISLLLQSLQQRGREAER